MGTTKLKTTFKNVYKCTITEYIQNRRMGQAEHLLANTDFDIKQIALIVGYKSAGRFSELFKRSTGLQPTKYRELSKGL
ncbi:helix-turn-helix domain-containing protein [Haloimpatiens myeolchijeotgali]